VNGFRE
jgi:BMFP domain-containing protein YqiC